MVTQQFTITTAYHSYNGNIEMARDSDESTQILATSQFESAILALREAAKSDRRARNFTKFSACFTG